MTVYAVRKRDGQWTVWSAQSVTMLFESYEEALEIARTAAGVSARCAHGRTSENAEEQISPRLPA
jgi:hypothetical protein